MVEMLAIFGFIGWLCVAFGQWVSSLPFFPALVIAGILVPIFAICDYRRYTTIWQLRGVFDRREPVPPERFYWTVQQPQLQRSMFWFTLAAAAAWWNVAALPASNSVDVESGIGWMNALVGIITTARVLSAGALFFRASQWFDCMTPDLIRFLRQAMYRLSDNYEYLGQRKRNPVKEEVY